MPLAKNDKNKNDKKLILASSSPRRRHFLEAMGLDFRVIEPQADETVMPGESPQEMVKRLSLLKATSVAAGEEAGLVIAADTTVVFEGRIVGKPGDDEEAARMLRMLRGRPHTVFTGVAVVDASDGAGTTRLDESTVWMRDYGDDEIAAYIARGEPLDKAGGYAAHDRIFNPTERVEGCFANVTGLPLSELVDALREFGFEPGVDVSAACSAYTGYPCCREKDG